MRSLSHFIAGLTAVSLAMLSVPNLSHAMSVTPMHMELKAVGNGSHAQFQVGNDSASPLPIEVIFERLSYGENGDRQVTKAKDELVVFPVTALIPPGGTQTFRVQWVGSPDIDKSYSFIVTARQLPIKFKEDGRARVQIVSAFGAILNVAPLNGAANLKLVSSAPAKTNQGKPALSILVENPTNVHALLSNSIVRVGSRSIAQESIRSLVGVGVVEPRKRRRFLVPLDQPAAGPATLEYRPLQR